MNQEYIESGILELYVFGCLSEKESEEVQAMAEKHADIKQEIVAIEKAVINLSYSMAPYLSAENYHKIRQKLIEKHEGVVPMVQERRTGFSQYLGWAAAIILLLGLGIQYYKYNEVVEANTAQQAERSKFEQLVAGLEKQNTQTEKALELLRGQKYHYCAIGRAGGITRVLR